MTNSKNNTSDKEIHTYIKINSTCNQKCLFCNRPPNNKTDQTSDFDDIKKRIKEASKNHDVTRLIFTGGEPLLHPRLPEIISYAKKYNLITEIQTNGSLLNAKISELKKSGLDIINFAFHSHKKEISNKLRGTNRSFEDITNNLKIASKMGFELHIIHVINTLNYQDLPELIDYFHQLNLRQFWLNLSLVVPEGWAWSNSWIVPRVRDIKPYLIKAMEKCEKYNYKFDVSEIVPLCLVTGFEQHAISTTFKILNLEIIDDYLTSERILNFADPTDDFATKAPQCKKCNLNSICAGFYPPLKKLYGVEDYIPYKGDPVKIFNKFIRNK